MPIIKSTPFNQTEACRSLEHFPPLNIVLPAGIHEYQCPDCGRITKFTIPEESINKLKQYAKRNI